MQFEAKKKSLLNAFNTVKGLTATMEIDGSAQALRLKAAKKKLKIASNFVEATVQDVTLSEDSEGECVVDMQSLQQALAVSGDTFSFSRGNKGPAQFQCGRSKGQVTVRDSGFSDAVLVAAPKATVHVAGLANLLSHLSLKGKGDDRTLHFDPKAGTVRGEASDEYRCAIVTAKVGDERNFDTVALSVPQKTCDALGKLVQDSVIGFDDSMMTVLSPGLRAVIKLSANAPMEITVQVNTWLESLTKLGSMTVKTKEMRDALGDIQSMVGAQSTAEIGLVLTAESTEATINGKSEAGDNEVSLTLEAISISTDLTLPITPAGLQECLALYKEDVVNLTIYSEALVIDLIEEGDTILSQTTLVPLAAVVVVPGDTKAPKKAKKAAAAEEDEEDEEPTKPAKAAKPAKVKEPEENDEEDEEPVKPAKAAKPAKVKEPEENDEEDEEPVKPAKAAAKPAKVEEPEEDNDDSFDEDEE